jgi:osmotically-inducible protein OsmY
MKWLTCSLAIILAVTGAVVPLATAQDRTVGQRVDDAAITAAVKTKLSADRPKNLVNVDVDTKQGVVRLQGMVPTEDARTEAERLARATNGVLDVKNDLTVSGPAASPKTR